MLVSPRRAPNSRDVAADPDPELVVAADRNFIASYEKLAEHQEAGSVQRFGSVTAFVSGLPISFLNGGIASGATTAADLEAAVGWLDERGYPYEIWIGEAFADEGAAALRTAGFERSTWPIPTMILRPRTESPPPADGVTVRAVEDDAALEEHIAMQVEQGFPYEAARRMYSASFIGDPDVRIFSAYLDGRPVGSSIAIRTGAVSGIYSVGTLPEARRRGVGTAVTWAAVGAAVGWGATMVALQSSEMGYPVYRDMGFEVLNRYALFHRVDGGPPPIRN
jgi:GNAT superfamily N-acetyltransferase